MRDPVFDRFVIASQRVFMFVVLTVAAIAVLWFSITISVFGMDWQVAWNQGWLAVHEDWKVNPTRFLLFCGAVVIGFLSIANVFLLIALRWNRASNIHQRGSILVDHRGGH